MVIFIIAIILACMLLVSMGILYVIRVKRARRPEAEFMIESDISNGRELKRLPAISYSKNEPTPVDFHYVNEHVCVEPIQLDTSLRRMNCCHCHDDCTTSNCECNNFNRSGPHYDNQGRLRPNYLKDAVGAIRECNIGCKCNRKRCKNMVIQAGSKLRIVLFKTKSRGWGVRTLEPIVKGAFIGNYTGELISVATSTMREDDTYLFNLSHSIVRTADRAKEIKQREGVIAQEQQVETSNEYLVQMSEEQLFICDAKYYGNFTRFINHSCEPNVVGIRTFTVHQDDRFPYISFFANKDIQAHEELTLNYGDHYWIVKCRRDHIYCLCKSPTCKFTKKTLKQTLKQHKEEHQSAQAM